MGKNDILTHDDVIRIAYEVGIRQIDEKILAAIQIGAKIGAETGAQVGAQYGAKAALQVSENERQGIKDRQRESICKDVKALLKNYRRLTDYCQHAVADIEDIISADEDYEDLMRNYGMELTGGEIKIQSIKKSYMITRWLMGHVNAALKAFRTRCECSGRDDLQRRWRVINALYIAGEYQFTPEELAELEYVEKRTIYRDIENATEELAFDIFGAGAVFPV